MDELDGHGSRGQLLEVVPTAPRGQKDERRPDALAPGREQVRHRRRHHVGVVLDQAAKACLDGLEISRNRTEDGVRSRL